VRVRVHACRPGTWKAQQTVRRRY